MYSILSVLDEYVKNLPLVGFLGQNQDPCNCACSMSMSVTYSHDPNSTDLVGSDAAIDFDSHVSLTPEAVEASVAGQISYVNDCKPYPPALADEATVVFVPVNQPG